MILNYQIKKKVYIGFTQSQLKQRIASHYSKALWKNKSNNYFQNALMKYNKNDFEWAQQEALKVSGACYLYLQPEWSKSEEMLPQIIDFVKHNQKWMVSLQTHKYMNIP